MDIIYQLALYTHIISGGVALVSGTVAMGTKKGNKNHKLAGKFF